MPSMVTVFRSAPSLVCACAAFVVAVCTPEPPDPAWLEEPARDPEPVHWAIRGAWMAAREGHALDSPDAARALVARQ